MREREKTAGRVLTAPVLALMALAFVLGTCEFVIVGILPQIAAGLDTSLAAVGKLVSVFAVCYAVGTPVVTAAAGRIPRRRLLAGLLALFLAANALSLLSPSAAALYAARVLAALVTGPLTAAAMLYARDVTPPEQTARAVSLVYAGFSVAAVAGVPLGAAVCRVLGWRWTFAVILAMGAALTPVLLRVLPETAPAPAGEGGFFRQFAVLRDRRFTLCVGMVLCSAAATYTVYTYLAPILTDVLGLSQSAVGPLLLAMGGCCAVSNVLSGRLGERRGVRGLPPVFLAQAALFALLPLLTGNRWTGLAALLAMGLLMYLLNTPAQLHALALAETDYPFASSLCASVQPVSFNFGIAAGSFAGSGVQEAWGLRALGLPAAVFALLAALVSLWLLRGGARAPVLLSGASGR